MAEKRIITAALTGNHSPKAVNPNVPVTPEEIAEDAYKCWKAGAAIVHLHMREADDRPTCSIELFRESKRLIEEKCDIIINMTTTGVPDYHERVAHVIALKPEMCSYDAGSMNWMNTDLLHPHPWLFDNSPQFLELLNKTVAENHVKPEFEVFHPGMIETVKHYLKRGELKSPCHFQFVLGVVGGLPATAESVFEMVRYLPEGSTWSAIGVSKGHLPVIYTALALGGHIRVGLEDTGYYAKGIVADNEMLVKRAARIVREFGCEPATPNEAREILGLPLR